MNKTFSVIDLNTNEEANMAEIALNEEWAQNLMYCGMESFGIQQDGH